VRAGKVRVDEAEHSLSDPGEFRMLLQKAA
jgi:hypothetical protein